MLFAKFITKTTKRMYFIILFQLAGGARSAPPSVISGKNMGSSGYAGYCRYKVKSGSL